MIVEPTWTVHVSTWLRFFVGTRLGPYHAMPQHVINGLLSLAEVSSEDALYDLGCGDGRLLIEAARQRRVRRAVGVELNPTLAQLAQRNVASFAGSSHPAPLSALSVQHGDARTADVSAATVLTLYLSHRGNRQLRPLLAAQLLRQRQCRVATFCFEMDGWTPVRQSRVSGIPLYLYNHQSLGDKMRLEAG